MGELKDSQVQTLARITHVSSTLSILGALFIIISFLMFKSFRKTHSYTVLIFWLSICDLGSGIAYDVVPIDRSDVYCTIQGSVIQFFQIGSFMWTGCIAVSLLQLVVSKQNDITKWFKWFHLVVWSCAAIDVAIGLIFGVFGDANPETNSDKSSWCWIKYEMEYWKFGLYFIPFFCVWTANMVIYVRVTKEIHRVVISPSLKGRAEHRIRLYLLVFMLCVGVGAVNRIQNAIAPGHPWFWLYILDAAVSPLQGFLNSIVYGMNKQLRERWKELIHTLCCGYQETESAALLVNGARRPTDDLDA